VRWDAPERIKPSQKTRTACPIWAYASIILQRANIPLKRNLRTQKQENCLTAINLTKREKTEGATLNHQQEKPQLKEKRLLCAVSFNAPWWHKGQTCQSPQLQISFKESQERNKKILPKVGEKEQLPKKTRVFHLDPRPEQAWNSTEIWRQRVSGNKP